MNGLHFFFGVGAFVAPLILARVLLLPAASSGCSGSSRCFSLPLAIWLWRLPEPPTQKRARKWKCTLPDHSRGAARAGFSAVRRRGSRLRQLDLHVCPHPGTGNNDHLRISDIRILGGVHTGTFAGSLGFHARPRRHDPVRGPGGLPGQPGRDPALARLCCRALGGQPSDWACSWLLSSPPP